MNEKKIRLTWPLTVLNLDVLRFFLLLLTSYSYCTPNLHDSNTNTAIDGRVDGRRAQP